VKYAFPVQEKTGFSGRPKSREGRDCINGETRRRKKKGSKVFPPPRWVRDVYGGKVTKTPNEKRLYKRDFHYRRDWGREKVVKAGDTSSNGEIKAQKGKKGKDVTRLGNARKRRDGEKAVRRERHETGSAGKTQGLNIST